uniref:asparagine synthase-related protein n=1 Tax=Deinococcus sp. TaxID=47478 RepID=UPI002869E9BD
ITTIGGTGAILGVVRYDSWQKFATNESNSIAQTNKKEGGWFELRNHAQATASEVLGRMQVNAGRELRWLAPYLSGSVYGELHAAWMLEYDVLLAQCSQWPGGPQRELELMIRQNEPYRLLPWRERFVGRMANIHVPYLDTQVLDFLGHLPVSLMADKRILKVALRQMDPQLFRVPLATTQGYEANWRRELLTLDEAALDSLLGFPSRLDALIDPPTIRRLMRALPPGEVGAGSRLTTATRQLLGTWRRTPLGRRAFGNPPIRPRVPKLPAVILNLLTLREVLRSESDHQDE